MSSKKWEYYRHKIPRSGDTHLAMEQQKRLLNDLGDDGWEAYHVIKLDDEEIYFLKREKDS